MDGWMDGWMIAGAEGVLFLSSFRELSFGDGVLALGSRLSCLREPNTAYQNREHDISPGGRLFNGKQHDTRFFWSGLIFALSLGRAWLSCHL